LRSARRSLCGWYSVPLLRVACPQCKLKRTGGQLPSETTLAWAMAETAIPKQFVILPRGAVYVRRQWRRRRGRSLMWSPVWPNLLEAAAYLASGNLPDAGGRSWPLTNLVRTPASASTAVPPLPPATRTSGTKRIPLSASAVKAFTIVVEPGPRAFTWDS